MDSVEGFPSEITLNSPVITYNYAKLSEKDFKRNLAARIYSNSGFTSIETGKPLDANTIAKDAINKANIFWDALPSSWKEE